jgi:hypothetical protein
VCGGERWYSACYTSSRLHAPKLRSLGGSARNGWTLTREGKTFQPFLFARGHSELGARHDGSALRAFPDLEKPVLLWAGGDVVTADLGTFEPPIMRRRSDADGMIRLCARGESAQSVLRLWHEFRA